MQLRLLKVLQNEYTIVLIVTALLNMVCDYAPIVKHNLLGGSNHVKRSNRR